MMSPCSSGRETLLRWDHYGLCVGFDPTVWPSLGILIGWGLVPGVGWFLWTWPPAVRCAKNHGIKREVFKKELSGMCKSSLTWGIMSVMTLWMLARSKHSINAIYTTMQYSNSIVYNSNTVRYNKKYKHIYIYRLLYCILYSYCSVYNNYPHT